MASDPVQHQRALALQRLRGLGQPCARLEVPAQCGPNQHQQQHRHHGEDGPLDPILVIEDEAGSGGGKRPATEHEEEQVAGQRLGPREGQRGD